MKQPIKLALAIIGAVLAWSIVMPAYAACCNNVPKVGVMSELELNIQRLNDLEAIKRLQRSYGFYLDTGAWSAAADLFTRDGRIEMSLEGVFIGRDHVRDYLARESAGQEGLREGALYEHMQLQPVVHIAADGNRAKARWRALVMAGHYGKDAQWAEGAYENEYVKQEGVWKIASLHWFETFQVPYAGGWAHNASISTTTNLPTTPTPDAPPTLKYGRWPAAYVPPFHYEQPGNALGLSPLSAAVAATEAGKRVQTLRDMADIENLVSAYGYYLDKNLWDQVVALYAEDGVAEIAQRGIYRGRASIRRMLELFGPQGVQQGHLHNHIQVQPVIHVAADSQRAWIRSRAITQLGVYNTLGIWGDSVYESRFKKVNGVWQIAYDHPYATFFSDYDQGIIAGARPVPGMSKEIPPDAPPSEVYGSFPKVYLPPFHYAHPVTGKPVRNSTPAYQQLTTHTTGKIPAELAAKLNALEASRDIESLQNTYGFFVDKALWREVADLFADDGTLEIGGRGIFKGRERIYEYLQFLGPEGPIDGRLINHIQLQPLVTVSADGNHALMRSRVLAQGADARGLEKLQADSKGVPTNIYTGLCYYENHFVKQNGVWKIAKLQGYFRMYTFDHEGWAVRALPVTKLEAKLPPDMPPSVIYSIYPHPWFPDYHYAHPVTGKPVGIPAALP